MSDVLWFTIVAMALYLVSEALLDFIERKRGKRFAENRQFVFFAIILPLALASFWLIRALSGPGG